MVHKKTKVQKLITNRLATKKNSTKTFTNKLCKTQIAAMLHTVRVY